jgi:hypothetical protein
MYADNQFLNALANKLFEMAENCIDEDIKDELLDLANKLIEQIYAQSNNK